MCHQIDINNGNLNYGHKCFYQFLIDITSEFLLFNDSPQISGLSLTVDFNLNGCAQVTCAVQGGADTDCKSFVI